MNRVLAVSLLLFSAAGCSDSSPERFELGQKALAAKDYDLALSCFNDYVKAKPNDPKGFIKRGIVHLESGRPAQAIPDFTEAIKLDPNNDSPYGLRSVAYTEVGRMEDSQADRAKAESLRKKEPG